MNEPLEKIDPDRVPKRKLYTGAELPAIGLGTYGSDHYSAKMLCGLGLPPNHFW